MSIVICNVNKSELTPTRGRAIFNLCLVCCSVDILLDVAVHKNSWIIIN